MLLLGIIILAVLVALTLTPTTPKTEHRMKPYEEPEGKPAKLREGEEEEDNTREIIEMGSEYGDRHD